MVADTIPGRAQGRQATLSCLREATREAHARIETVPAFAALTRPDCQVADYVAALRGLYAFHAALRRLLPGLLRPVAGGGAFSGGPALAALAADLRHFGVTRLPAGLRLDSPPRDAMAALGALYVLEGSALGGRVIARHVSVSLGVAPGAGGHFFCGTTAAQARDRWRGFVSVLEAAVPDGESDDAIRVCGGALNAFGALEAAMRKRGPAARRGRQVVPGSAQPARAAPLAAAA